VHSPSIRARRAFRGERFSPHVPSPNAGNAVCSRADDEPSAGTPRVSARGISELFDSYFDVFGLFALQPKDESSFTAGLPTPRRFEERNPASERRRVVKSPESLWKILRKLPRPGERGGGRRRRRHPARFVARTLPEKCSLAIDPRRGIIAARGTTELPAEGERARTLKRKSTPSARPLFRDSYFLFPPRSRGFIAAEDDETLVPPVIPLFPKRSAGREGTPEAPSTRD